MSDSPEEDPCRGSATADPVALPEPTITAQGASGVVLSSVGAAISSYVVLLLVARSLTPAANADFLAFWSALFAVIGVLGGVQSESTRAVGTARIVPTSVSRPASIVRNGLVAGLALAALLVVSSPGWADRLFPHEPWLLVGILAFAALGYAGHAAVAGASAGRGDWTTYSRLMGLEAVWRLCAVAVVVFRAAHSVLLLPLACISSAAVWIGVMGLSARARPALRARADVEAAPLVRQTGHALLSAASTAALVVGFPVLLRLTTSPAEYATSAPLILAISITRAPILLPLQAFQGVFISSFVKQRERGLRALALPTATTVGIGLVGVLGAYFVGPAVMTVFGSGYRVDPLVLAALTLDATLLAVLTLSGTAALASGNHRMYSAGWLTATGISALVLALPLSIGQRAVLSLAAGPMCGIVVHWIAIGTSPRFRSREEHGEHVREEHGSKVMPQPENESEGSPAVSIIVPVYNGAQTVERALLSVLGQTEQDFEIIAVDDTSTDDSVAVLRAFKERHGGTRMTILVHPVNRGVSAARNTGVNKARGRMVAFMDCDDEYHPDFVRVMAQEMEPGVDVVVCGRIVRVAGRDSYARASRLRGKFSGAEAARHAMADRITPFACDKMFRRELLDRSPGYPEGAARFEDLAANVVLHSRARSVRAISTPLYVYNIGGQSATWGRIPTIEDTEVAIDFVDQHVDSEVKQWRGRRYFEGMRTFVTLQVAQSAMARPVPSVEATAVIRACRQVMTVRRVGDLFWTNPSLGVAAAVFKLAPVTYSRVYRRHIQKNFGVAASSPGAVALQASDRA